VGSLDELLSSLDSVTRRGVDSAATLERIRVIFADLFHLNASTNRLTYEEMLEAAVSLDSIAVLEFLMAVEKEFGVELEPAVLDFEFLRDIEALASYIEDRQKKRALSAATNQSE